METKERSKLGKASAKKGKADKNKIRNWYRKQGWACETCEKYQMIFSAKGRFVVKRDLWGADLIATNGVELIFIQCKQNRPAEFKKAREEFAKYPVPKYVRQVVAYWNNERHCAVEVTE